MSCPCSKKATTGTCPFTGSVAKPAAAADTNAPATNSTNVRDPASWVNPYANCAALTASQTAIVKSTAPILAVHGVTITKHFYKRMFGRNPDLLNVFNVANQATGMQPASLAAAVHAYAAHIDDLGALTGAVMRIAHKHASINIEAAQYPIVGENLLASIQEVLGSACTADVVDAWTAAYAQLANLLIVTEKALYDQSLARQGGWNGWKQLTVLKRVEESDEIVSFYLHAPNERLPTFTPGQYISVRQFVPALNYYQPRQYSLSASPNPDYFRISIKRESACDTRPAGQMSNHLHDTLKAGDTIDVSMPYGDYGLENAGSDDPIVLISGGVGETPNVSILAALTEGTPSKRPISFIHSVRTAASFAMKEFIDRTAEQHTNVSKAIFVTRPADKEEALRFTHSGRIDLAKVDSELHLNNKKARYFLCGPDGFSNAYKGELLKAGVDAGRIHDHTFGPTV